MALAPTSQLSSVIGGLWTSNQKVIGLIPVGSIRIYYCAACGPIKKMSRVYVEKKTKWRTNLPEGVACPILLTVGPTSE